jgi:cell division septum initiation protein DivIVA
MKPMSVMRSGPKCSGLLALLIPLALSCGSKEPPDVLADMRGGIDEIVSDDARAARMRAALDELESTIVEADSLFEKERITLDAMVRNYGSTREEIERSLAEFNTHHETFARRFLASHAALKAEATAEEWKKLRELEMSVVQEAVAPNPAAKEE